MLELWLKILDIMDRLMNSGQGDSLVCFALSLLSNKFSPFADFKQEEAVPESLKNIILVMSNGGYLEPPTTNPEKSQLWSETWKRVERFLPNLKSEIFPETENENPQISPPPAKDATPPPEQEKGNSTTAAPRVSSEQQDSDRQ